MAEGDVYATGEDQTDTAQSLEIGADGSVLIPEGHSLSDAGFEMVDGDLVMSWSDGSTSTVEGFGDTATSLVDSDGAQMSADMAQQLAEIDAPAATSPDMSFDGIAFDASGSDMVGGTDGAPIGNVDDVSGSVFAVRVDGTRVELNVGDPVFQGDILESGPDGSIGVILADETTFSMGEDGHMVLDEMIYDPGTQEGTVAISVLEGVFTFVSGQVAKTDPDAMTLDTPVATIGIRGTQVGINLEEGKDMEVVLMEEGDGFVGEVVVQNDGGVVILNQAFAGTNIGSFNSAPAEGREIDHAEFLQNFGAALKALPNVNNANTYGVTEQNIEIMIEDAIQQLEQDLQDAQEEAAATAEAEAEIADSEDDEPAEEVEEDDLEEDVVEEPEEQIDITLEADPVLSSLNTINFDTPTAANVAAGTDGGDENSSSQGRGRDDDVAAEDAGPVVVPDYDVTVGDPTVVQFRDAGGTFVGSDGVDYRVIGGTGADRITTADGDDYIYSRDGIDVINAGAGDDIIEAAVGGGDDIYDGGEGVDWVIFPSAQDGYDLLINLDTEAFDLSLGDGQVIHIDPQTATDASDLPGGIDTDTLINIENILGGQGDDIIVGTDGNNILAGGLGSDMLFGGDGDDTLIGGSLTDLSTLESAGGYDGHDTLVGGAGYDTAMFSGSFGDYTIEIDQNDNLTLTGPYGSVDTLIGIEELRFDNGEVISVGLPPVVSVEAAAGDEDTAITLNIDAALADGLGALSSITISDIPEGSVISIGTDETGAPITVDVVNGEVVLTPDQLATLTITPPENFGDDFALSVTAEREIGFTSEPATLTVNVSPVADAPDVSVSSDTILVEEGRTATFDLSAVTTDASETISEVQVSGIPDGSKLFVPVGDGDVTVQIPVIDGVATIPVSLVSSVIIQTPEGYSSDYDLLVSATSMESDGGDTATSSVTVHVDMSDEVAPVVTVQPAAGDEDQAIPLNVSASVSGGDAAFVTISGIPDDAIISIGTDEAGNLITVEVVEGTVSLTPDQLDNLAITPASNDDTDFDLSVTATSHGGLTSDPVALSVDVAAVADAPVVTFAIGEPVDHDRGSGNEGNGNDTDNPHDDVTSPFTPDPMFDDPGSVYPVSITAALSDVDGSESLSVNVSGVPDGVIFNAGTDNGDGTWTFTQEDMSGDLQMFVPVNMNDDFSLSVNATATEGENADTAVTSVSVDVDVKVEPDVTVIDGAGDEDTAIALDISTAVGGGEALASVTIDDIPEGAVISVGSDAIVPNEDGTVTVSPDQLSNLTITPPLNSADDFNLQVTATSTDGSVSAAVALAVTVIAVADAPTMTLDIGTPETTDSGEVYPVAIEASLDDVDQSETLSVTVTLVNAPEGALLSAGTDNGDGTWTLEPQQLDGLTLTVPEGATTDFSIEVTATSTEQENLDTAVTSQSAVIDVVGEEPGEEPGEGAIVGTDGSNILIGSGESDEIWGMGGHDLLVGRGGDDTLKGGEGSDALFGGGGADALFGGAGNDLMWGGGGSDFLAGGTGDDVLTGGGGADTFIFDADSGSDIIKDIMEQDSIVFEGQEFHAEDMIFNENEEGNVEISFQNVPDSKVTLEGVSMSDLDRNNDGDPGDGYSITESDGQVTITLDTDG